MDEPFYYRSAEDPVPRDAVYVIVCGSVTVVPPGTFRGFQNLARVELHEGVEEIGERAFAYCINLARVDCRASSLRAIDGYAFAECRRLSELILREGLRGIGAYAFCGCDLKQIAIPSSVMEIGELAFAGCNNLEGVSLGPSSFAGCNNLEGVTLVGGTVMVARGAFFGCPRLARITISSVAIVVEAGEHGNSRVVAVIEGIEPDPANGSLRLILASPYLVSMHPEDLANLTDAIDQIAATMQGAGPLNLAAGEISGRIRDGFVAHLSMWYKREVATILELALWKIELGRVTGGGEAAGADVPTREGCRNRCGADPIVGLVLSSLAGPHRRMD